jgi:hypothetical protein
MVQKELNFSFGILLAGFLRLSVSVTIPDTSSNILADLLWTPPWHLYFCLHTNTAAVCTGGVTTISRGKLWWDGHVARVWEIRYAYRMLVKILKEIGAKTEHVLSRIWLTMPALPRKGNRLLLGRPLLVTEYGTAVNSVRPVATEPSFRIWAHSARPCIFMKVSINQWNLIRIVGAVFAEILILWLIWKCLKRGSYSFAADLGWIPNVNKMRLTRARAHTHTHTYIHIYRQTERRRTINYSNRH